MILYKNYIPIEFLIEYYVMKIIRGLFCNGKLQQIIYWTGERKIKKMIKLLRKEIFVRILKKIMVLWTIFALSSFLYAKTLLKILKIVILNVNLFYYSSRLLSLLYCSTWYFIFLPKMFFCAQQKSSVNSSKIYFKYLACSNQLSICISATIRIICIKYSLKCEHFV
jgi:hypothetical protein